MRIRGTTAALALGVALGAVPSALADRQGNLENLREAIVVSRDRVAVYEREQRGLLEAVEALDRSMAGLRSDVIETRRRAEAARATLATVEEEAAAIGQRKAVTERAMASRAVALYKAGSLGPVRMLFAADGFRDLLSRMHSLQLLLSHDAELLERHRTQTQALRDAEVRARGAIEGRDEALADLAERTQQLAEERRAKARVVSRLYEDRAMERAALVELEAAAEALEETVASIRDAGGSADREPASLPGPAFASLRRRLSPPVDAPIVKGFGRVVDDKFHTATFHKGVVYGAARGALVHSVAGGTVRFAGWFRGYGKLVILDHGDQYFTILGHLENIGVEIGDRVGAGDAVGQVGETGSLAGPRLYFEIRHGSEPQDPVRWLASASTR